MMAVSSGCTLEHRLGQEALSPQRDESPGVKVIGMQAPEAHADILATARRPGKILGNSDFDTLDAGSPKLAMQITRE